MPSPFYSDQPGPPTVTPLRKQSALAGEKPPKSQICGRHPEAMHGRLGLRHCRTTLSPWQVLELRAPCLGGKLLSRSKAELISRGAMRFLVTIEQDEVGYHVVECPALRGCISQGKTREEAFTRIREAILLSLETRKSHGLPPAVEVAEIDVATS